MVTVEFSVLFLGDLEPPGSVISENLYQDDVVYF
jgi:hypothetical protein